MRKYIVKPTSDTGFPAHSVWMRCGPGNRNLLQLAICPCGQARKLARVLNALCAVEIIGVVAVVDELARLEAV